MENSLFSGVPKFRQSTASFEANGKLMILGVPILKHFRVYHCFLSLLLHIYSLPYCTSRANNEDPDQTTSEEQSDPSLQYLPTAL